RGDVETPGLQIGIERSSAQLRPVEDLEQRIAQDENLLATSDHHVIIVVGMRAGLAPFEEAVGPGGAEDAISVRFLTPLRQLVGARDDDSFAGGGLEADRQPLRAA